MSTVYVERKATAGGNRQKNNCIRDSRFENEDKAMKIINVDPQVGITIAKVRNERGWTQKDLALKLGEKQDLIARIEAGKAAKNAVLINRISQLLNVRLKNPGIGDPLRKPKEENKTNNKKSITKSLL